MGEIDLIPFNSWDDLSDDQVDQGHEPVSIDFVRVIHETDKAWRLLLDDSDFMNPVKEWFPKSRCLLDEDAKRISVPVWLAMEKGLI